MDYKNHLSVFIETIVSKQKLLQTVAKQVNWCVWGQITNGIIFSCSVAKFDYPKIFQAKALWHTSISTDILAPFSVSLHSL